MTAIRVTVLLAIVQGLCAFVLAVTLHALTRAQDPDLALLAFVCRVAEGIVGLFVARTLGLLWLASSGQQPDAARALGGFLLRMGAWHPGAVMFAIGSTIFSWLLLRGRTIPAPLGWLGLAASLVLVIVLPLDLTDLAGAWTSAFAWWVPMLVFEIVLALWLLIKGGKPV